MIDTLKPGQMIQCTVVKAPRTEDRLQTIMRLMRKDPATKRALRKAHRSRMQNLLVYSRGNRDWTSRKRVGKIVRVAAGETWTMPYTPDLAPDFKSVEQYLEIKGV